MAKIFKGKKSTAVAAAMFYASALAAILCCGCDPGLPEAFMAKRMVTVSFDANGGNPADISPVDVPSGLKPGEFPSNPARIGYTFDGWFDGNTLYTSNTVIAKDVALKAKWTAIIYTLTVNASDSVHGTVTSASLSGVAGTVIGISTTASRRYVFENWSVTSGTATIADSSRASTTVTLGFSDATVTANFRALPLYTLIAVANDSTYGTVTPASESDIAGTEVDISATASSGYVFQHWSVTSGTATIADSSSASTTVTLGSSDATVTANFAERTYTLTVRRNPTGGGTVTPSSRTDVAGTEVNIRATAGNNYTFQNWSVTSGTATIADRNSAATTVTIGSSNATVTANFLYVPPPPPPPPDDNYRLTVVSWYEPIGAASVSSGGGTVSPLYRDGVEGAVITITATNGTYYTFDHWEVTSGSADIADEESRSTTVTLYAEDVTVTAYFRETSFMFGGQRYNVVKIGDQWWMEPNINYPIANESWCYGDNTSNCAKYGRLYTWQGAENVCDALKAGVGGDWHLPADSEWETLVMFLNDGGTFNNTDAAAKKLKSTSGWWVREYWGGGVYNWADVSGTNESGFSALPGGMRYEDGSRYQYIGRDGIGFNEAEELGSRGYWWSDDANMWSLRTHHPGVTRALLGNLYDGGGGGAGTGFSVRCVK